MDTKLALLLLLITIAAQQAEADFWFNHVYPQKDELGDLKCIPGKTLIQVEEAAPILSNVDDYDSSSEYGKRRSHMNFKTEDKSCKICVCSVSGKDEYCSSRPAMNVNECIRMAYLMEQRNKNDPHEHEKSLSFRIRRDYLWHNDEIPYYQKARCRRGHSYYSNSQNANETDIDVGSEVESLLDYPSTETCYYCVCTVDGENVGCMSRKPWFCQHFRFLREPGAMRDMYRYLFKQDRATYFRSLSWRLRRTMDTGMFDLVDSGGDALCCGHADGHRRSIHNRVRNQIRILSKQRNKEDLLSKAQRGDYVDFIVNND